MKSTNTVRTKLHIYNKITPAHLQHNYNKLSTAHLEYNYNKITTTHLQQNYKIFLEGEGQLPILYGPVLYHNEHYVYGLLNLKALFICTYISGLLLRYFIM
jgi:hypothetical protein